MFNYTESVCLFSFRWPFTSSPPLPPLPPPSCRLCYPVSNAAPHEPPWGLNRPEWEFNSVTMIHEQVSVQQGDISRGESAAGIPAWAAPESRERWAELVGPSVEKAAAVWSRYKAPWKCLVINRFCWGPFLFFHLDNKVGPSVYFLSLLRLLFRVMGVLEPVPAVLGWRQGFTPETSPPVYRKANTEK